MKDRKIILPAPAKVNLFLEITGKRDDGYHNLYTLFLKIALTDMLTFSPRRSGIVFSCSDPALATAENLVCRAAALLQKTSGFSGGARIHLRKRIPCAAGLGGGSSDAAATLLGLNRLWGLGWDASRLLPLARKLGADVPVFIRPEPLLIGRGRGDILRPVPKPWQCWLVLVKPAAAVSTGEIFRSVALPLTKKTNNVKLLLYALAQGDYRRAALYMYNRLETVTLNKYSELAQIKKAFFALGVPAVLMSGSGSVIFGLVPQREEALRVGKQLQGFGDVMVVAANR
ncbi:MAG: 4-(cytidine 5'-diphospho)-2-C-methyl-D-erythritol kinase [Candidatus Omnitrophica bacterium]|nr:4-(cytidine 5'-diphospho)-2-C-methyl-D-erythritol kinase [Candidatus Omnitrophota bacterium]